MRRRSRSPMPSLDMAIVRLGWTPEGQRFDRNKYLSGIVAALPQQARKR